MFEQKLWINESVNRFFRLAVIVTVVSFSFFVFAFTETNYYFAMIGLFVSFGAAILWVKYNEYDEIEKTINTDLQRREMEIAKNQNIVLHTTPSLSTLMYEGIAYFIDIKNLGYELNYVDLGHHTYLYYVYLTDKKIVSLCVINVIANGFNHPKVFVNKTNQNQPPS